MRELFWDMFAYRSLVLYLQLHRHSQQHGFLVALTILGDVLQVKSEQNHQTYIRSFSSCEVDPTLPMDTFVQTMKVCRAIYANEFPARYRIDSYLCEILREVSLYHLEKDSYILR